MRRIPPAIAAVGLLAFSAGAASSLEDGDKAFAAGDFTAAAADYAAAVRETPGLADDPAFAKRLARARAGASCEAAERLLSGKHGLGALEEAEAALKLAPDWPRAAELRRRAAAAAADEGVARAEKKMAQADPAGAEAELKRALDLAPGHVGAKAAEADLAKRRSEARRLAEAAAKAMSSGAWDEAEDACRRSLTLDAAQKETRERLGEVFTRRADALAARGQAGTALVSCRRGAPWAPAASRRAETLLEQVRQEEMPRFRFQVEGPQDLLVAKWLAARNPAGPGAAPVAEVAVRIVKAEAKVARVKAERVSTPWYEDRLEPNPERETARLKLAKAEAMLDQALAQRGSARRESAGQVATWQNTVRDLLAEYRQQPEFLTVRVEHTETRTEETWRAVGKLALKFEREGADPVVAGEAFDKSVVVRLGADGARRGADLPGEAAILEGLGKQALDKALPALREPALISRIARLRRAADKAAEAGDPGAALESRARAAALTGVLNAELGEASFRALEAETGK